MADVMLRDQQRAVRVTVNRMRQAPLLYKGEAVEQVVDQLDMLLDQIIGKIETMEVRSEYAKKS